MILPTELSGPLKDFCVGIFQCTGVGEYHPCIKVRLKYPRCWKIRPSLQNERQSPPMSKEERFGEAHLGYLIV